MNKTMMRNMTINEMMNVKDDLDRESLIILADKLQERIEILEWNNESLRGDLESDSEIEDMRSEINVCIEILCAAIDDESWADVEQVVDDLKLI